MDARDADRVAAQTAIDDLSQHLGQLQIGCDSQGAEISVDGRPIGAAPLSSSVWAVPGRHQVTARLGRAAMAIEEVDVPVREVARLEVRLIRVSPPAETLDPSPHTSVASPISPSSDNDRWMGRKWTWVAAGAAGAFAVGGTTFGLLARSKYDELRRACGAAGDPAACRDSDVDTMNARSRTANVLWGAAGVAAVAAGVLFYVEGRQVNVSPLVGEVKGLVAKVEL